MIGSQLQNPTERRDRLVAVAALGRSHAVVERLFDLPVLLLAQIARELDPPRRLLVVDLDQVDPRPAVDRVLEPLGVERALALGEELRDAVAARVLGGLGGHGFELRPQLEQLGRVRIERARHVEQAASGLDLPRVERAPGAGEKRGGFRQRVALLGGAGRLPRVGLGERRRDRSPRPARLRSLPSSAAAPRC